MRHLLSNIISAFIRKKSLRDKVRTMIRYPQVWGYIRYVRHYARNMKHHKIKTVVGYGCKNFVVILNDKHVFKFPLLNDGFAVALRETRITDAFRKISPIKIPEMRVVQYKGVYIRKYEFAYGTLLTDIDPKIINKYRPHIARQIANFLYVIGTSDPAEIRDLKNKPNDVPGFMYGWFQGDIWQNFMLDTKTFDINFFIDWEGAAFMDFGDSLRVASHNWDKFGYKGIIVDLMAEYAKLYFGAKKK